MGEWACKVLFWAKLTFLIIIFPGSIYLFENFIISFFSVALIVIGQDLK